LRSKLVTGLSRQQMLGGVFEMVAKRAQAIAVGIALVILVAALAGCGASKGVVKSVTPKKGIAGTGFKVTGTSFGKTQDKSTVTMSGKKATVVKWSDTSITAIVPRSLTAGSYKVAVVNSAGASNTLSYQVLPTFTASTPMPAMTNWLKNQGIDTNGMTYTVVSTSTSDPNWKLDKATKTGGPTYYFLVNKGTKGWTIIDAGTSITTEQLKIDGAPSDLKAPTA
jgi:uncharacterized protein (TIGR03437 family)